MRTVRETRDTAALMALPADTPITLAEAANVASVSLRHIMQERALGRGPRAYRIGPKTVRTTVGDVLEWLRSRAEVAG